MKPRTILILLCITGASLPPAIADDDEANTPRGRWAARIQARRNAIKTELAKLADIRSLIEDMDEAIDSGDKAEARRIAKLIETKWKSLPPRLREAVERRRPGTAKRLYGAINEGRAFGGLKALNLHPAASAAKAPAGSSAAAASNLSPHAAAARAFAGASAPPKRTFDVRSTTVRDGNTKTTTGTATNARGEVVRTYEGSTTRVEKGVLEHEHTISNKAGETIRANDTTVTRSPGSYERDTTITTRDGKTVEIDVDKTRSGNTADTSKTVTGKNGKTFTYEGTAVKEGRTVTMEGQWQNEAGKTVRTVDGSATRKGNVVKYEKQAANAKGETVRTREGAAVKHGGTVKRWDKVANRRGGSRTYRGSATRSGGQVDRQGKVTYRRRSRPPRAYKDGYDLFGNRPGRAAASAKKHTARTSNRAAGRRKSPSRGKR